MGPGGVTVSGNTPGGALSVDRTGAGNGRLDKLGTQRDGGLEAVSAFGQSVAGALGLGAGATAHSGY